MTVIYEFPLKQTLTGGNREQWRENSISLTSYLVGLTHLESHLYVCHLGVCVCVRVRTSGGRWSRWEENHLIFKNVLLSLMAEEHVILEEFISRDPDIPH